VAGGLGPLAHLRDCKYTGGMNTDAGPPLSQVLDWLDEGARRTVSDRGAQARPEHVIWTMLEREVAAMKSGDGLDRNRASWVMTWLRYMRYRGASPVGVRQAAAAVALGAKARHVAGLLGRSKDGFTRQRLADFKARIAELVIEGLRRDYGIGPLSDRLGFGFVTICGD